MLFLIFLDFQKAFDFVDHRWLYRVINNMSLQPNFIRLIKNLHMNAKPSAVVGSFIILPFESKKSVRM